MITVGVWKNIGLDNSFILVFSHPSNLGGYVSMRVCIHHRLKRVEAMYLFRY